jgi:D-arabinose 1-dehydrogenase-like Zn-dependent alcohol dehydrogenase
MRCGRIVVIGEEPEPIPIDTIEIAQQELEIIGSRNGTRADMQEAIHLVESGIVLLSIAARFRLEEINAAFGFVRAGALGRVVIT